MIFRLCGFVGVDPSNTVLTFREVNLLAQGRYSHEWNYWASLCALLANINRDPKKQSPFRPEQFHPFADQPKTKEATLSDYLGAQRENARRRRLGLK